MKKYLFSLFFFLFIFSVGIVFSEENLIAQVTTLQVGKLSFQIPSGFKPEFRGTMYSKRSGLFNSRVECVSIRDSSNHSNKSKEQVFASIKENSKKMMLVVNKIEEIDVDGRQVLFVWMNVQGLNAYFFEDGLLYDITYVNYKKKDYNTAKSFVSDIIRTAR